MLSDSANSVKHFHYCIRLPGHFGGCSGNGKWSHRGAQCSKQDEMVNVWVSDPSCPPTAEARGEDPIVFEGDDQSSSQMMMENTDEDVGHITNEDDGADCAAKEDDNEASPVSIFNDELASEGTLDDTLCLD
ncbi:uncharacterized protein FTOL_08211 [Fusarium torulosum]|uniref:Uncharacterized protein n=1 Tax=Fusarium torulosum TaxID=33205 RepID=A0AAE8MDL0_9HYPO|nr:uncharacterized protein FTOL_08211 [Fusarium torulosum]